MTRFDTDLPGSPHLPPGVRDCDTSGSRRSHLEGLTGRIADALIEVEESTDIDPYDLRDPNDTIGGRL